MTVWTRKQQAVVAILPKLSSFCTAFGSLWIMIEVLTHKGMGDINNNNNNINKRQQQKPKRQHPYHRLLFMMSFYDFLEAIFNFMSTWTIPIDSPNRIWASGNRTTCSTQGFFLQLAIAVPIYNAFLSLYYMLVINFHVTERTLIHKVEPTMHIIAGTIAWGTALSMVFMGYMNDANLWCWIAPYPQGCSAADSEVECTRGQYYWIFRWSFYFAPLWLSILTATFCTIAVYCKVRRSDIRTLSYRRPEIELSSRILTSQQQQLSSRDLHNHSSLSSMHLNSEIETNNNNNNNNNTTNNNITSNNMASEFRVIAEIEQKEDSFLLPSSNNSRLDDKNNNDHDQTSINKEFDSGSQEFKNDEASVELSNHQNNYPHDNNNDNNNNTNNNYMNNDNVRRSSRLSRIRNWHDNIERYKQNHKTSVEVFHQSMYYMAAFYLTHVWSTTNRIYQQLHNGRGIFPLTVIHSFFDPFQGMMNFLVYQRPRYLIVRKTHPELGRIGAIKRVLHFSFMQHNTKNDVTDNSSAWKVERSINEVVSSKHVITSIAEDTGPVRVSNDDHDDNDNNNEDTESVKTEKRNHVTQDSNSRYD